MSEFLARVSKWARRIGVLPNVVDITAYENVTAKPLDMILQVLNAAVPKLPYDHLTKAQQTIAEASVYIAYHRVPQAITFLRELESDTSIDPAWLEDVIWCLETAQQMPGTDLESFNRRRDREQKQREYELERLSKLISNSGEQ